MSDDETTFEPGCHVCKVGKPHKVRFVTQVEHDAVMINELWYYKRDYEVVQEAFEVGDYARYRMPHPFDPRLNPDLIYEVKDVKGHTIKVGGRYWSAENFEKIKDKNMEDAELEVGDVVRCIDVGISPELSYGQVYEVQKADNRGIKVNDENYWYDPSRFMKVEVQQMWNPPTEVPEHDDLVIAVDDGGHVISGAYNQAEDRVECLYDGLSQYISWEDVQQWTPKPETEAETQANQDDVVAEVFGEDWTPKGDGEYLCGYWKLAIKDAVAALIYMTTDEVNMSLSFRQSLPEGEDLESALKSLLLKSRKGIDAIANLSRIAGGVEHVGLHTHRLDREAHMNDAAQMLETRFHDRWTEVAPNMLGYILGSGNERAAVSPDEARIAATVVQWLGTPVGQNFLDSCGFTFQGFPEDRDESGW